MEPYEGSLGDEAREERKERKTKENGDKNHTGKGERTKTGGRERGRRNGRESPADHEAVLDEEEVYTTAPDPESLHRGVGKLVQRRTKRAIRGDDVGEIEEDDLSGQSMISLSYQARQFFAARKTAMRAIKVLRKCEDGEKKILKKITHVVDAMTEQYILCLKHCDPKFSVSGELLSMVTLGSRGSGGSSSSEEGSGRGLKKKRASRGKKTIIGRILSRFSIEISQSTTDIVVATMIFCWLAYGVLQLWAGSGIITVGSHMFFFLVVFLGIKFLLA